MYLWCSLTGSYTHVLKRQTRCCFSLNHRLNEEGIVNNDHGVKIVLGCWFREGQGLHLVMQKYKNGFYCSLISQYLDRNVEIR